ncbi:hypothetical protein D3C85_1663040 [compost metagenome]
MQITIISTVCMLSSIYPLHSATSQHLQLTNPLQVIYNLLTFHLKLRLIAKMLQLATAALLVDTAIRLNTLWTGLYNT